jgi:hypothetical protein
MLKKIKKLRDRGGGETISEFKEVFRESIRTIMPKIWDETFKVRGDILSEIYLKYLNSILAWNYAFDELNSKDKHSKITGIECLREIRSDAISSIVLAVSGFYRPATIMIRSMLELSWNFIYYCNHPVEYEWWTEGKHYISTKNMIDYLKKLKGVNKFSETIYKDKNRNFIDEVAKTYNELSKYIHASAPVYMHRGESQVDFYYDEQRFNKWKCYFIEAVQFINTLFLLTIEQFDIIDQESKEAIWRAVRHNRLESLKETRREIMSK